MILTNVTAQPRWLVHAAAAAAAVAEVMDWKMD
jgi:hypothetical protein